MSNVPFPLKPGEQVHQWGGAKIWHNDDKLFTAYRIYLTTHRVLGIDDGGRIAFNHFHKDVGNVEVGKSFWRDFGLTMSLKNGTSTHVAFTAGPNQDPKAIATQWANLIQGHMLNLDG
jgi:hypothetical protein